MNRNILVTIFVYFVSAHGHAQSITDPAMTFFGIDFSKARMIGKGFGDPAEVKNTLFNEWNGLFKVEPDKYDLYRSFRKESITFDFTNVEKRNAGVNITELMTNNEYSLTPEQVEDEVRSYDTHGMAGLGCVFVVESFNKPKVMAAIYVVFFDVATKRILLIRRLEEPCAGFGLRNYWAKSIYALIQYSKELFPRWVKGKE